MSFLSQTQKSYRANKSAEHGLRLRIDRAYELLRFVFFEIILNCLIKYAKLNNAKPIEYKIRGNFCFLRGYYTLF